MGVELRVSGGRTGFKFAPVLLNALGPLQAVNSRRGLVPRPTPPPPPNRRPARGGDPPPRQRPLEVWQLVRRLGRQRDAHDGVGHPDGGHGQRHGALGWGWLGLVGLWRSGRRGGGLTRRWLAVGDEGGLGLRACGVRLRVLRGRVLLPCAGGVGPLKRGHPSGHPPRPGPAAPSVKVSPLAHSMPNSATMSPADCGRGFRGVRSLPRDTAALSLCSVAGGTAQASMRQVKRARKTHPHIPLQSSGWPPHGWGPLG